MDNINSHINVKFDYLLNEYNYFFIIELILTTLLNTCIILIVILI